MATPSLSAHAARLPPIQQWFILSEVGVTGPYSVGQLRNWAYSRLPVGDELVRRGYDGPMMPLSVAFPSHGRMLPFPAGTVINCANISMDLAGALTRRVACRPSYKVVLKFSIALVLFPLIFAVAFTLIALLLYLVQKIF